MGQDLELNEAEQTNLAGFEKVWLAGYLDGSSHINIDNHSDFSL